MKQKHKKYKAMKTTNLLLLTAVVLVLVFNCVSTSIPTPLYIKGDLTDSFMDEDDPTRVCLPRAFSTSFTQYVIGDEHGLVLKGRFYYDNEGQRVRVDVKSEGKALSSKAENLALGMTIYYRFDQVWVTKTNQATNTSENSLRIFLLHFAG